MTAIGRLRVRALRAIGLPDSASTIDSEKFIGNVLDSLGHEHRPQSANAKALIEEARRVAVGDWRTVSAQAGRRLLNALADELERGRE